MDIRAPVNGVIYNNQVFALQSVIAPAAPIMFVISKDQPLIVVARIEAIHTDQVYVGQNVALRFTAFDQRTTPEVFGHVSKLSADIFTDEATGLSFYQTELLPNASELSKLGGQTLLRGMPVGAYFKTAERSPLRLSGEAVGGYINDAFREG